LLPDTAPGDEKEVDVNGEIINEIRNMIVSVVDSAVSSVEKPLANIVGGRDPLLEIHLRDAYLVFTALCRLSMKPLPALDSSSTSKRDAHLVALRSKILSLELLSVIVREHFTVVSSTYPIGGIETDIDGDNTSSAPTEKQTSFIKAVKQYLCVSLSRNSVSLVPEVLERSLDIFVRCVLGMKAELKVEIEVFLNEIFLVGLEARTSFYHQKMAFVRVI
jgi:brefeldin A-inhibited guanine nucleotide-exchange protein